MTTERVSLSTPITFLENFKDKLDDNGGISDSSINVLVGHMKQSKDKLVPKSLALTIISMSSSDIQMKLCESGVWNILFQWLQDGLKHDTTCFVVEILKLYLKLPITFSNLKSNACPKLIKKLTKSGNEDIVILAKDIYHKWKEVVVENTNKDVPPSKKIKLDDKSDKLPIEDKKRFSTVKVKHTILRTAGIEEESEITKYKKNEVKNELKNNAVSIDEIHQKVNDKRKVLELHESKNFINSITSNTVPPKKKKKRPEGNNKQTTSDISMGDESASDLNLSSQKITEQVNEKPKKRVSWAPADILQDIKYFELDENERVNVNRVSIEEMRRKEKLMEKQNVARRHISDNEEEGASERWVKPLLVSGIDSNIIISSQEKNVQFERESRVLKVFYFSKDNIPSSPGEPDVESYDAKDPKVIPMSDNILPTVPAKQVQQQQSVQDDANSKLLIFTEKDGNERQATLRPDVANLLKSMTQNTPVNKPVNTPVSENTSKSENNTEGVIKSKLIGIIRTRYPDVDPEKLSSEEVCKLLEPMKDQLMREGILNPSVPNVNVPPTFPNQPNKWYPDHRPYPPPPPMVPHGPLPPRPFGNRPMPPNRPFNPRAFNPTNNRPICKYFANSGFCRQGNNCSFSHVNPDYSRPFNQNRH